MKDFDIIIIGAGAVGNAIAYKILKKNNVSICLLEKEPDLAFGTSGRNSGVLHAGFNNKPGTLMGKLCILGSMGFEKEARKLGVEFKKTGKLVLARYEEDMEGLEKLISQGIENKVQGLSLVRGETLEKLCSGISAKAAIYSENTGIFDPFKYTVALGNSANVLGASYFFGRKVSEITSKKEGSLCKGKSNEGFNDGLDETFIRAFKVKAINLTNGEEEIFSSKILINSAGLYADQIDKLLGIFDYNIYPCRGEYHILEKASGASLGMPIYPVPNEKEGGLGVHLTPTIDGNVIIGPSAEYLTAEEDREDYKSTAIVMKKLLNEGEKLFPEIKKYNQIRSFSGIRPKLAAKSQGGYEDFVIEEYKDLPGYIRLLGIESPGLTSSLPIGDMISELVDEMFKRDGIKIRKEKIENSEHIKTEKEIKDEEMTKNTIAAAEKSSKKMICSCEKITEQEILRAYDEIIKIGAIPTIKGLKNRTRVTMGSCQGGFCTVNIVKLLAEKRDMDPTQFCNNGFESQMFSGRIR